MLSKGQEGEPGHYAPVSKTGIEILTRLVTRDKHLDVKKKEPQVSLSPTHHQSSNPFNSIRLHELSILYVPGMVPSTLHASAVVILAISIWCRSSDIHFQEEETETPMVK